MDINLPSPMTKGKDNPMNKRLWDLYAPIYERAMRSDERIYEYMYRRIPQVVRGLEVLEELVCPQAP